MKKFLVPWMLKSPLTSVLKGHHLSFVTQKFGSILENKLPKNGWLGLSNQDFSGCCRIDPKKYPKCHIRKVICLIKRIQGMFIFDQ